MEHFAPHIEDGGHELALKSSSAAEPFSGKELCYCTKLCRFWQQGRCKRGSECAFAHGLPMNVRDSPQIFKTSVCENSARTDWCGKGESSELALSTLEQCPNAFSYATKDADPSALTDGAPVSQSPELNSLLFALARPAHEVSAPPRQKQAPPPRPQLHQQLSPQPPTRSGEDLSDAARGKVLQNFPNALVLTAAPVPGSRSCHRSDNVMRSNKKDPSSELSTTTLQDLLTQSQMSSQIAQIPSTVSTSCLVDLLGEIVEGRRRRSFAQKANAATDSAASASTSADSACHEERQSSTFSSNLEEAEGAPSAGAVEFYNAACSSAASSSVDKFKPSVEPMKLLGSNDFMTVNKNVWCIPERKVVVRKTFVEVASQDDYLQASCMPSVRTAPELPLIIKEDDSCNDSQEDCDAESQ